MTTWISSSAPHWHGNEPCEGSHFRLNWCRLGPAEGDPREQSTNGCCPLAVKSRQGARTGIEAGILRKTMTCRRLASGPRWSSPSCFRATQLVGPTTYPRPPWQNPGFLLEAVGSRVNDLIPLLIRHLAMLISLEARCEHC